MLCSSFEFSLSASICELNDVLGQWFPRGAANYFNFSQFSFFIIIFISIHWCRYSTICIRHLVPHAYL